MILAAGGMLGYLELLVKENAFSPLYPSTLKICSDLVLSLFTSSVPPTINMDLGKWFPSHASALLV